MKQTAVEWLLNAIETKNGKEFSSYYTEFIEQAKEMEKSQHDETAEYWWKEGAHYVETQGQHQTESFDKYYEERFKK
jgi:hypothetical protein